MVFGTKMKWNEVREKSIKILGGRVMNYIYSTREISGNGYEEVSQKVKTPGFASFSAKVYWKLGF